MATASPLLDVDDSLLKCSICLNVMKQPKLLPCLHRFCFDCLKGLTSYQGTNILCPECRMIHPLPANGIDGFQTDIGTVTLLQVNKIQKAVLHDASRKCVACPNTRRPSAFCFKCSGFLCQSCFHGHRNAAAAQKHQPYVLPLQEVTTRKLSVKDIAPFTDISRCSNHSEHVLDICCKTCTGNKPICRNCCLEEHRGHDLSEVTTLASEERKRLSQNMESLLNHNEKILEIRASAEEAGEKLNSVFERRSSLVEGEIDHKIAITKQMIHSQVEKFNRGTVAMDVITRLGETSMKKRKMEEKLKELNDEYEKLCQKENEELEKAFKDLEEENKTEEGALFDQLGTLKREFKTIKSDLGKKFQRYKQDVKITSDFCDQIESRLRNIQATVSAQLSMQNDWIDLQTIPGVCFAIDSLGIDMKRELPNLQNFSDIRITRSESTLDRNSKVFVSEDVDRVIAVAEFHLDNWGINGISGNAEGKIVLTGEASKYSSHITVVNEVGEIVDRREMESDFAIVCRYCDFLSQFKLVTASWNTEIGIFDILDGTYVATNLRKEIDHWPSGREVSCIAVDSVNQDVFLGVKDSRDVYVLNDHLKYSHAITLPAVVRWPKDIAVHGDNLIVCDRANMEAYIMTLTGTGCRFTHRFAKPDLESGDCWPIAVCTDKAGFIYLIWSTMATTAWKRMLLQYSHDGKDLRTTRLLDDDACSISTVATDKRETLLVATWRSGRIFLYSLKRK